MSGGATIGFLLDAVLMVSDSLCLEMKVQKVQMTDADYFESCDPFVAWDRFSRSLQLYSHTRTTTWQFL